MGDSLLLILITYALALVSLFCFVLLVLSHLASVDVPGLWKAHKVRATQQQMDAFCLDLQSNPEQSYTSQSQLRSQIHEVALD